MKAALRTASIRGFRTLLQAFAGSLVGLPIAETLADVRIQASALLLASWIGLLAGLISFAQNLAELLTEAPVPRG